MRPIMLNVIVCAPIIVAWLAVCGPWYLSRHLASRRRRREQAAWTRLEPELSELDGELDRAWMTERERSNRKRHP
jgi:hypothetical protein